MRRVLEAVARQALRQRLDHQREAESLVAVRGAADQLQRAARRGVLQHPWVDPARPVRMPGDQAARGIEAAQRDGIEVDAATWQALRHCARDLGVTVPD